MWVPAPSPTGVRTWDWLCGWRTLARFSSPRSSVMQSSYRRPFAVNGNVHLEFRGAVPTPLVYRAATKKGKGSDDFPIGRRATRRGGTKFSRKLTLPRSCRKALLVEWHIVRFTHRVPCTHGCRARRHRLRDAWVGSPPIPLIRPIRPHRHRADCVRHQLVAEERRLLLGCWCHSAGQR